MIVWGENILFIHPPIVQNSQTEFAVLTPEFLIDKGSIRFIMSVISALMAIRVFIIFSPEINCGNSHNNKDCHYCYCQVQG